MPRRKVRLLPPRCVSCGRFFRPDRRTRSVQKTCGRSSCRGKNSRRQQDSWRLRNMDRVRAREQDYRDVHREELNAYMRSYYAKNRDLLLSRGRLYQAEYNSKNREKKNAYSRAYYWRNRDARRAYLREYNKKNRVQANLYTKQKRLLDKNFPGFTKEDMSRIRNLM